VLARGFAEYAAYPTFMDRYKLRALAIARYPMYRGVARLVGMEIQPPPATDDGIVEALRARWDDFDFFFLHFKYADSRGEDGDFGAQKGMAAERYFQTDCFEAKGMIGTLSHAWSVGLLLYGCECALELEL